MYLVKVEENKYKIKISQPGRKTDIIEYKEWHGYDVKEIKIWRHNNPNVQSLVKNFKEILDLFLLLFRAYLKQNLVRLTINIKYMKHSNNEVLENVISSDRRLFFFGWHAIIFMWKYNVLFMFSCKII